MSYFFHPVAQTEHLESVAYYETKRAGLGASYLTEFETIMSAVSENPHRYPVEKQPDIRRVRMKRVPYNILFREFEDSVQVLAVAHMRRHPQHWQSRL